MASTARTLTFLNNKGGVGKTTLACNMAYELATHHNCKVLLIDLDPQCNATQLLLPEETWTEIIANGAAHRDKRSVLYALSEIRRGDSTVHADIIPVPSERFNIDVLTGHPLLSLLEDSLSQSWGQLQAGDLGGARRTNWLGELIREGTQGYDFVVADIGPSLGALNRSVMINTDDVVTPTAADLFSLYALDNIAEWVTRWGKSYLPAIDRVIEQYGEDADANGISKADKIRPSLVGYTIQQYVSKSNSDGSRRAVKSHDYYRQQIPSKAENLATALGSSYPSEGADLGTVPHMFSMVPLAQARHAPIASLTATDGLRGAQLSQQAKYREQLRAIGEQLFKRLSTSRAEVTA